MGGRLMSYDLRSATSSPDAAHAPYRDIPSVGEELANGNTSRPETWTNSTLNDRVDALLGEMLTSDQLDDIPPLRPVVAGYLYADTLARINGASSHGKTFVALDIAGCVGTGTPWHGHDVEQGEVVYLVAEGAHGIRKRVRAWEAHHEHQMTGVRFLPRPVQATDPEWLVLTEACRRIKPHLIICDTQARITVGVEESSNTEMGVVVEHLERMRRDTGACVTLVHHLGLQGDHGRGATAVKAALQTELTVSKNRGLITVATSKQKDHGESDPLQFQFRLYKVGVNDDGWPITSGVLVINDTDPSQPQPPVESPSELKASFMAVLQEVFSTGSKGGTKAEIRSVVVTERGLMGRSSFYKLWNELAGARHLTPGEKGVWFYEAGTAADAT
jgi:hypothetical protein